MDPISRILEPLVYKRIDFVKSRDLQIGFKETMHGTYDDGKDFTFEAEIIKRASTLAVELRGGNPLDEFQPTPIFDFKMSGSVNMEDICSEAVMKDGIFMIIPLTKKLMYYFSFESEDRHFTYAGAKDLSLRNPIKSITHLYGDIIERGEYVSCCENPCSDICNGQHLQIGNKWETESYFDLKELPEFLWSFVKGAKLL